MAMIWLVPAALLVGACVLTWRWQQTIEAETDRLRGELRALPVMTADTRAVQIQSDRIARSAATTSDYFGSTPRH